MRYFLMIFLLLPSLAFSKDRVKIEDLSHLEQCVYRARVSAVGAYFSQSKTEKSCENIKIFWHKDESEFEIEYIKKWVCYGFNSGKDPISIGDSVYKSCLDEKQS